jgi:hypothetical protein
MTRTITITGTLPRKEAILEQVKYVLRSIANLNDGKISKYVKAVSLEYIHTFTFYALKPGTNAAEHYLVVKIDWNEFIKQPQTVNTTSDWYDNVVNPDIHNEAQEFLNKCIGFEITWDYTYNTAYKTELYRVLDRKSGSNYVPPTLPKKNPFSYTIQSFPDVRIEKDV